MPQVPLSNIPIRPINKGMYRNLPPNGIPMGGFLRTQNMRITESGMERRHGMINFDENADLDIQSPILDIIHFYRRQNQSQTLYLSEKSLFIREGLSLSKQNLTYSVEVTANTGENELSITMTEGTDLYEKLRKGDQLSVNSYDLTIENIDYTESAGIYTFTLTAFSVTAITDGDLIGTGTVTLNFVSELNMTPSYALLPTETVGDDKIVISDQADRGLYLYDTTGGFSKFKIDSSTSTSTSTNDTNITSMRTIAYFDGRLWAGNTVEIDGEHRQRIRWSDVNDFDRFRFDRYVDLPYTEGQLLSLVPLGSLLVAYFEDAVYLGRFTNRPDLPYLFTRMETGMVGPVSDRAITKWVDRHYFVGQDDIYELSEATGINGIGAPIISETISWAKRLNQDVAGREINDLLSKTKVVHDIETDSIAFLIPDYYEETSEIFGAAERIWRYFYKTGAWSYDEVFFNDNDKKKPAFLYLGLSSSKVYLYGDSWEEWVNKDPAGEDGDSDLARWIRDTSADGGDVGTMLNGDTFDDYPSWYALIDESVKPRSMKISIYKSSEDRIVLTEEDNGSFQDTVLSDEYPIWVVIESPDYDLNTPDITKTFNRVSIKSFQNRVDRYTDMLEQIDQVSFYLQSSTDFGHTFKRPQLLRWRSNYNEGKADFRATGSAYRFKIVSSDVVPSYKLSEMVIRLVSRGLQIND